MEACVWITQPAPAFLELTQLVGHTATQDKNNCWIGLGLHAAKTSKGCNQMDVVAGRQWRCVTEEWEASRRALWCE